MASLALAFGLIYRILLLIDKASAKRFDSIWNTLRVSGQNVLATTFVQKFECALDAHVTRCFEGVDDARQVSSRAET